MERYYNILAVAFVRGMAQQGELVLPAEQLACPLEALTSEEREAILRAGETAGLRMYHLKQKALLPRVNAVLGFLRGIQPERLLDVGSGRGAFLLPFLTEFPRTEVTAVDLLPHRVQMLQAIASGGIETLTVQRKNICDWTQGEATFDVVTLLEVLEHIPDVALAVSNAVRLAKRFVVVSVPSHPDNNPEHIHLLTKDRLTQLFTQAGCSRLQFGGVNGHLILIATKGGGDTRGTGNPEKIS